MQPSTFDDKEKRSVGTSSDTTLFKKPRVWGIVILGILRALFSIYTYSNEMQALNEVKEIDASLIPGWMEPLFVAAIGLAIFAGISSILIAMYKRWGLYFGLIAYGGDIVVGIIGILLVSSLGAPLNVPFLAFVIDVIVVRYIYMYMTEHPTTEFFT